MDKPEREILDRQTVEVEIGFTKALMNKVVILFALGAFVAVVAIGALVSQLGTRNATIHRLTTTLDRFTAQALCRADAAQTEQGAVNDVITVILERAVGAPAPSREETQKLVDRLSAAHSARQAAEQGCE